MASVPLVIRKRRVFHIGATVLGRSDPVTPAEKREIDLSSRILIVEDDLIQQQVLERFLTSHGYYVATAATGLEAIKKIRDGRFDVIILDYAMPGFDGVDAAKWIRREMTGFTQPYLIAFSANIHDMLRNEPQAETVFDHVEQKPWNSKGLVSILRGLRPEWGGAQLKQVRDGDPHDRSRSEGASPNGVPEDDDADAPLVRVTTCLEKVRVLILDDDESVLSTFRTSLEEANYDVTSVASKAEAIKALEDANFDIVFADYFGTSKFCGSPAAFLKQVRRPEAT